MGRGGGEGVGGRVGRGGGEGVGGRVGRGRGEGGVQAKLAWPQLCCEQNRGSGHSFQLSGGFKLR